MYKYLIVALGILCCTAALGHRLSGKVTDKDGVPLPYVSVYVANTTYGVASNLKGDYYLELENGTYDIVFQMVGYERQQISVTIKGGNKVQDVVLQPQVVEMAGVVITATGRDPAFGIVKKVIQHKRRYLEQYEGFRCRAYIKASLEGERYEKVTDSVTGVDSLQLVKERLNFVESFSTVSFRAPGQWKEVKDAYRDLATKTSSAVQVVFEDDGDDPYGPPPETNPFLFFLDVSDADFNFYRNNVVVPELSEKAYVSPFSKTALLSYKYRLDDTFKEGPLTVHKIEVIPRRKEASLFKGYVYVADSLWAIKAVDLEMSRSGLQFFRSFRVIQNNTMLSDSTWIKSREEFFYNAKQGNGKTLGHTIAAYSDYALNPVFERRFFNNELRAITDEAYDRDSTYWATHRPVTLKEQEQAFIHEQDSIIAHESSEEYLRQRDSVYNAVSFWDITLNGVGFRNRYLGREIWFKGLIEQVQPLAVGGYRHSIGGYYEKEYREGYEMQVDYDLNYGFNNKDLKGQAEVAYLYAPKKFGEFYVGGGKTFDMINSYESIAATFSRSNYVQNDFYNIGHKIEVSNGVLLDVELGHYDLQSLEEFTLSDWSEDLFGSLNAPQPFERYRKLFLDVRLHIRFQQKYVTEPYKKVVIGTEWPQLFINYKKAVPTLLGSDVNFNYLEMIVTDNMRLGTLGESKYRVNVGKFVSFGAARFIDYKFFRGSDRYFFSDPLKSFQLLGPTLNTNNAFLMANYIHHFNGMVMNKIPLVNKLRLEAVAGGGTLVIPDQNDFRHAELYAGLEKQFRIGKQLFKIGGYYVAADSNHSELQGTWKFGIDFYDSFRNKWSY